MERIKRKHFILIDVHNMAWRLHMNDFYLNVGDRIKKKRLSLKLTREGLANMADISDKFLYDIEVGNKGMSAKTLYNIKEALNVSADWLLDGNK